jgi:hypothetical protein
MVYLTRLSLMMVMMMVVMVVMMMTAVRFLLRGL